jgi:N-acetylglucosamine malate deacetylase 2
MSELLFAGEGHPSPGLRAALIAAHPDDEVIGAGAALPLLCPACVMHVTDGAPPDDHDAALHGLANRSAYAAARRAELSAALALSGLASTPAIPLGCIDQRACCMLVALSRHLASLLRERRIGWVITHAYEGGHPDHDATAFAVCAACKLLRAQGADVPEVIEMTSYHMGPHGIETGTFLPVCPPHVDGGAVITLALSERQRALKHRLFACFPSQRQVLSYFQVDVERFRPAPTYDFRRPPHDGKLFYEHFDWGMTGGRFRALAGAALEELGIEVRA